MLKVPAYMHKQFPNGETVTVYQDDAKFWKFYLIPGFPTVRTLPNGDPVFLLIKYAFSDASREDDPELGAGGGYLVFDAELKIRAEHMEELKAELKTHVQEEWDRLSNAQTSRGQLVAKAALQDAIGDHWGQQGHRGTRAEAQETEITLDLPESDGPVLPPEAPEPIFGEPLWTGGKVTMSAPSSPGLVSTDAMPRERTASLVGNNVAAFSLDLTPDGSTFFQKTLVGEDGSGATDLTPIQIHYELSMKAKLPPAKMYLKFDTSQVYHAVQELFHEHTNCTDDYFTSENMMQMSLEAGLVTIKIDMGGIEDDDLEQMMMDQAMDMSQQLLVDRFAEKERAPMEEWADEDVQESHKEIYRLKRQSEVDMTSFEQTLELRATTEITVAPQGTLATFLHGRDDMDRFVREIDLDDDFFKTLSLKARAFAAWEEDDIEFVEVEVKYDQGGTLKTETFTFTPEETEPQEWDPSLVDGQREYEYRWRVGFTGREPEEWSDWEDATTRDLNVAVETPGKLGVEVTGVGIDYENVVDAALVHLRYEDASNDVAMASRSILLSQESNSGRWERMLFAPWDKPVEYKVEYLLENGARVVQDWTETDGPTDNLLITRPQGIDVLDVKFIPAGSWEGLAQTICSVRYEDGDLHRDRQYKFADQTDMKEWQVLLRNPDRRDFEYQVVSTFTNGESFTSEWLQREGDGTVAFRTGPDRLEVTVSPATLDFASTPVVKVDLKYQHPDGQAETESYSLQAKEDQKLFSVPLQEGASRTYQRKITYFPVAGDPVEGEWEVDETELIMVPAYRVPKVGAKFLPTTQDFTRTPVVEVNLTYDDPQRGAQESATLVFTAKENQEWFHVVPEEAPREYEMTVTWHFADGRTSSTQPTRLSKPAVVLPPAVAPAPPAEG